LLQEDIKNKINALLKTKGENTIENTDSTEFNSAFERKRRVDFSDDKKKDTTTWRESMQKTLELSHHKMQTDYNELAQACADTTDILDSAMPGEQGPKCIASVFSV
jgi:hypothetical protein